MKDLVCPKCGAGADRLVGYQPMLVPYKVDSDGSLNCSKPAFTHRLAKPFKHVKRNSDFFLCRCLVCNARFYVKECEGCGDVVTATLDSCDEETCERDGEREELLDVTFDCPSCWLKECVSEEHHYASILFGPEDDYVDGEAVGCSL
jgi:hypothetical protein